MEIFNFGKIRHFNPFLNDYYLFYKLFTNEFEEPIELIFVKNEKQRNVLKSFKDYAELLFKYSQTYDGTHYDRSKFLLSGLTVILDGVFKTQYENIITFATDSYTTLIIRIISENNNNGIKEFVYNQFFTISSPFINNNDLRGTTYAISILLSTIFNAINEVRPNEIEINIEEIINDKKRNNITLVNEEFKNSLLNTNGLNPFLNIPLQYNSDDDEVDIIDIDFDEPQSDTNETLYNPLIIEAILTVLENDTFLTVIVDLNSNDNNYQGRTRVKYVNAYTYLDYPSNFDFEIVKNEIRLNVNVNFLNVNYKNNTNTIEGIITDFSLENGTLVFLNNNHHYLRYNILEFIDGSFHLTGEQEYMLCEIITRKRNEILDELLDELPF